MFPIKEYLLVVFCAMVAAENTPIELLSGPLQFSNLHVGDSSEGKDQRDQLQGCSLDHVVRAKYDALALPETEGQWQIQGTVFLGTGCYNPDQSSMEIIFSVGVISIAILCNERALIILLDGERLPTLTFPLYAMAGSMPYNFLLRLSTVSGYAVKTPFRDILMSWSYININGEEIMVNSEAMTIGPSSEQESSNILLGSFDEKYDTAVMTMKTMKFEDLRKSKGNKVMNEVSNVTEISIECVEMTEIDKQVVITSTASINGSTVDSIRWE
jgi:hypothetical protein